jgi:hypothetical protein
MYITRDSPGAWDPKKRSTRSSCSACLHEHIHSISIYPTSIAFPHGRPPSLLPSALSSLSPLLGACHTTLLCPPPAVDSQSGAVAHSGVREFAGCLGSAPHRLHRLCA